MFTKEELEALLRLVDYASENIGTEEEPLINDIIDKLKDLIIKQK